MRRILGIYKNGNVITKIFDDGTKERITKDDEFKPAFAESCDVNLTMKCDGGCAFCYAGCTATGYHSDILNQKWIDTLHPFTELALNGNDMSHPDLIPLLEKLKSKKVIANLTVNQKHFMQHKELLRDLVNKKLVRGLGISLVDANDEFIESVKEFDNAVIHTINGILTKNDMDKLADNELKILILGYKNMGRGENYLINNLDGVAGNQQWLHDNLSFYLDKFKVISFDNLALKQLEIKNHLTEEEWNEFYMGDDGDYTFYIDAVNHTFAKSSLASKEVTYPLMDSIDDMFKFIQSKKAA